MASITPRASGFWADSHMTSSYFPDEDLEDQNLISNAEPEDGRTPLDKTIDRIGMGSYQWTLLSLCGFGWMADNMWIQAIAIILPRVQQHYSVPDHYIGMVSSSMFAGMMFGAVGWGTCSDLLGRSAAFNATLFFTSLFGLMASFVNSFPALCVLLFFLGSAVGGSMPTDGTLLLEHMPKKKQYLVTALSVFFSFGSVLSAVVALLVVPQNSCPTDPSQPCDPNVDNRGWKYLLITLGLITFSMFLARIVFFRLHESPRYLVHAGRPREALESLQMISRFNGSDLSLELEDVEDQQPPAQPQVEGRTAYLEDGVPKLHEQHSSLLSGAGGSGDTPTHVKRSSSDSIAHYQSTGESPTPLTTHSPQIPKTLRPARRSSQLSTAPSRRASSIYERKVYRVLPRWLRRPLWAWWDRVLMVLSPDWARTTILVWATWCSMSLAYTMFNVYLPKLLETSPGSDLLAPKTLEQSLWDVVIFTIGGCPGAILGAYMIESSLGRKWSLAGTTFVTAFFCTVFVMVQSAWAVRLSTVGISLSATAAKRWTPEIFGTKGLLAFP
ncbi:major facilitator superfamily domain-containing protein [Infundibulicybe gibba]|nr:major facilitator superfamily domain-containing protein [Infundibulicybe gibba]